MNIWETDKLILFLLFVIPGFISLKAYQLLIPGPQQDSSKQIVDAVAYSCLNYALLSPLLLVVESAGLRQLHPLANAAFFLAVLFLAPLLWVYVWLRLRRASFFQDLAPHPTVKPWDFVFSQRKPFWIKATLKDGTKLGGKYAGKSFASSAPSDEQLFLEESWILNDKGGFDRMKKRSSGVIIMGDDLAYVELIKFEGE